MSRTASFFGLTDASERILKLAKIMILLNPIISATVMMSTTFYVIFVAEAIGFGDIQSGMLYVGILVAIQMGIQVMLDYPSGAIGDWIGQRWIISSAFILHGIDFYLLSLVTSATPFTYLILIYALEGIAFSQQSGAWGAWFDNNYRAAMPGDTDRKQYGVFQGKVGFIFQVVSTLSLIPGSLLATIFSRQWVFQLQAILCVGISLIVLWAVRDFPEVIAARKKPTMSEYKSLLKDGAGFLVSDQFVFFLVVGTTLTYSVINVWGNLILFPMYYLYLITDVAVASFRTTLFLSTCVSSERSGIWSRRFEPKKWIPRFRFIQTCGFIFFFTFAAIMLFFPPVAPDSSFYEILLPFTDIVIFEIPTSHVLPIILIFFTYTLTLFFGAFADVLTQRKLLDIIPNRIRNSMYSLQPTLVTLFALPQIIFFGWLLNIASFPLTLACMGLVSLFGVFLLRYGLHRPEPIVQEETWGQTPIINNEELLSEAEAESAKVFEEPLVADRYDSSLDDLPMD